MNTVKIEGVPSLIRDLHSKAVINTDTSALNLARERKRKVKQNNDRISRLEDEIKGINELLLKIYKHVAPIMEVD